MGKEISSFMIRKFALFLVFIVFAVVIAGCETAKGAAKGAATGAKADWQTTQQGAADCWEGIKSADQWVKDNLW